MKTLFLCLMILVSTSAQAAEKRDANLMHEGELVIVKREACLSYGGRVADDDKRYFICRGGKYDGTITPGPLSDPEGDSEVL